MDISVSSWNVNGVRKLRRFFQTVPHTKVKANVIMLQETWVADKSNQLVLRDYIAFHEAALPSQGHNVMGLSSLFHLAHFSGGKLEKLQSPLPWVLAVRWSPDSGAGVLFVNIYAAIHTTGTMLSDVEEFRMFITDLRSSFGADELVIAGDWNLDKFRRPTPISSLEREMLSILRDLESDGFKAFPSSAIVTYADLFTTLDYYVVSRGVDVVS
jgi:exonuclease III